MVEAIVTGVTTVVTAGGTVLDAIVKTDGAMSGLLPVIGMAIGMGVVGWAVSTIKSLTWGF